MGSFVTIPVFVLPYRIKYFPYYSYTTHPHQISQSVITYLRIYRP